MNLIIENKGGVSCVSPNNAMTLPLPVAGLMSGEDGYEVAASYTNIDAMAKSLGFHTFRAFYDYLSWPFS